MKTDPERSARDLLTRHAIIGAPPVPVEDIARAEGIQIARASSAGHELGFLLHEGDRRILGLNSRRSARRQRQVIAHELGHWKLHGGRQLLVDHDVRPANADSVSSIASVTEEAEANAFAGELLMPADMLRAAVSRELGRVSARDDLVVKLAAEFDVGTQAVTWRLLSLGVFT